jgi:hypothetical protein
MPRLKLKICGILAIFVLLICNGFIMNELSKDNKILIIENIKLKEELGVAKDLIYYQFRESEKLKKELKWRKQTI